MIRSFADKEAESVWSRMQSRHLSADIQNVARRKLRMLNSASTLVDLRVSPGKRLEALKSERKGQNSIRINDQWRICFRWREGDAHDVEIVDYHRLSKKPIMKTLPNIHPGEVLLEEFLIPMGISQNALARAASVPPAPHQRDRSWQAQYQRGHRRAPGACFWYSERFWLGLQTDYDLEGARNEIGRDLKNIERIAA